MMLAFSLRAHAIARSGRQAITAEQMVLMSMVLMSMEVRRGVLGEEGTGTLSSRGTLGLARELGRKYVEAEATHRQERATSEKVLGREHPMSPKSVYCHAYLLAK